jgi:hypothetical protein
MSSNVEIANRVSGLSSALGLIALLLVFVLLTGRRVPLVSDERGIFIALAVVGFLMCTFGGLRGIQPGEWLGWGNVFGIMMGILAGILIIGMLIGIKLPSISGYREASLVLVTIILSKWIVGLIVRLVA